MKNKKTKPQQFRNSHLLMFFKIDTRKNFVNTKGEPQVIGPAT